MASPNTEPAPAPMWAYVAPMVVFLVLTNLEGYLPQAGGQGHPTWYPVGYAVKIAVVAAVMFAGRSAWRDLRPWPGVVATLLAVGTGAAVAALWVGLDGRYPEFAILGSRSGFDPTPLGPAGRIGFITIRLIGLVLIVPLFEELFWRSFLMRWLINPEFQKVPIGRVTPVAAAVTSALFAVAHPEWLPALITGALWAWLLWQTKSLAACVISHAVANLGLGVYVLSTGAWKFW